MPLGLPTTQRSRHGRKVGSEVELCSDGHDEIVYAERKCPLCAVQHDLELMEKRATDAEEVVEQLQGELESMER